MHPSKSALKMQEFFGEEKAYGDHDQKVDDEEE